MTGHPVFQPPALAAFGSTVYVLKYQTEQMLCIMSSQRLNFFLEWKYTEGRPSSDYNEVLVGCTLKVMHTILPGAIRQAAYTRYASGEQIFHICLLFSQNVHCTTNPILFALEYVCTYTALFERRICPPMGPNFLFQK